MQFVSCYQKTLASIFILWTTNQLTKEVYCKTRDTLNHITHVMYHRVRAGLHFNRIAWGTLRAGNWSSMLCPVLAHGPYSLLKRPLSSRLHHTSPTKTRDSTGEVGMSSQTLFSVFLKPTFIMMAETTYVPHSGVSHVWEWCLLQTSQYSALIKKAKTMTTIFLRACWIPAHLDLSFSEQSLTQGLHRLLVTKKNTEFRFASDTFQMSL